MPPGQVMTFIIGTIVILFGAYYVTYFVGMKASGRTRTNIRNKNIRMIDRYAIARDKQFCIIEVAGKVYIVGVTNNSVALLDTFDAATFAELTENDNEVTPWNMTPVGQYGNRLTKRVVAFIAEKTGRIPGGRKAGGESGASDFSDSFKKAQRMASEAGSESDDANRISSDTLSVKSDKSDALSEKQTENPEDD